MSVSEQKAHHPGRGAEDGHRSKHWQSKHDEHDEGPVPDEGQVVGIKRVERERAGGREKLLPTVSSPIVRIREKETDDNQQLSKENDHGRASHHQRLCPHSMPLSSRRVNYRKSSVSSHGKTFRRSPAPHRATLASRVALFSPS